MSSSTSTASFDLSSFNSNNGNANIKEISSHNYEFKEPSFSRGLNSLYGTRKGKWTVEEERYTNKVIETFNKGTLQLAPSEKSITLRAYLAEKLDCDPMRITKKYTGDSCLGKRVFRSEKSVDNHNETVERDRQELEILEREFQLKLRQTSRGRTTNVYSSTTKYEAHQEEMHTISTPAIDALIMKSRRFNDTSSAKYGGPHSLCKEQTECVSSQHASFDALLHSQHLTHDQFLRQLTEEAAEVLLGRRLHNQHQTVNCQGQSEKDDESCCAERSLYQPRKQQLHQETKWRHNQLNEGLSHASPTAGLTGGNQSMLATQFHNSQMTSSPRHTANEYAFDDTLFGGKRVRPHSLDGEEEDGTDTAVRSLLGFHHRGQQHILDRLSDHSTYSATSLPLPTESVSEEVLVSRVSNFLIDSPDSSSCSSSRSDDDESDVSGLSTEALSGFV